MNFKREEFFISILCAFKKYRSAYYVIEMIKKDYRNNKINEFISDAEFYINSFSKDFLISKMRSNTNPSRYHYIGDFNLPDNADQHKVLDNLFKNINFDTLNSDKFSLYLRFMYKHYNDLQIRRDFEDEKFFESDIDEIRNYVIEHYEGQFKEKYKEINNIIEYENLDYFFNTIQENNNKLNYSEVLYHLTSRDVLIAMYNEYSAQDLKDLIKKKALDSDYYYFFGISDEEKYSSLKVNKKLNILSFLIENCSIFYSKSEIISFYEEYSDFLENKSLKEVFLFKSIIKGDPTKVSNYNEITNTLEFYSENISIN